MPRVIPPRKDLLERLRDQSDDAEEIHPHLEELLRVNPPNKEQESIQPKKKHESIQWVIDSLGGNVVQSSTHDKHKCDAIRADENISWCPECKFKWNIYEGRVWKSPDIRLWKEKICPDCDSPVK